MKPSPFQTNFKESNKQKVNQSRAQT